MARTNLKRSVVLPVPGIPSKAELLRQREAAAGDPAPIHRLVDHGLKFAGKAAKAAESTTGLDQAGYVIAARAYLALAEIASNGYDPGRDWQLRRLGHTV